MTERPPIKRLVRTSDAIQRIGCGPTFFWGLLRDGRLEAVRLGSRTMVLEESLNAFLASLPRIERAPRAARRPAPAAALPPE
jgi:hypothetical protein